MKITSQYDYDYTVQECTPVSDEILTIPEEDFTIQELMARAVARTMPDIDNGGYYDEIDDDIDFNDIIFSQISTLDDLNSFRDDLDHVLSRYNQDNNKVEDLEKNQEVEKISPESSESSPDSGE